MSPKAKIKEQNGRETRSSTENCDQKQENHTESAAETKMRH